MTTPQQRTVFDFSKAAAIEGWRSIDDRIMGGCSQSRPEAASGGLCFAGAVSLENNGGFASIRSPEDNYDLAGCTGLRLRVRGDGHVYKLSLRTDRFYDGISYQAAFQTRAGDWEELDLPFGAFVPTHHGIVMSTVAPLDPAGIQSFGLFIADRQDGPFRLEVAWVKAA